MTVSGTEYLFTRDQLQGGSEIVVDNFLILPSGKSCRNMDEVENAAQSRRERLFGAGEVQFVFDARITAERRHAIVERFLGYEWPVLGVISSGGES
jgi:hypothetical protein